mmetsp:Transcript_38939/g.70265  ORF Transcript_38939/g.70265 Transcript_38939/m.70265 type:complete len:650 (+) Transcript_38939:63-2012(+)
MASLHRIVVASLCLHGLAVYLPGLAPREYKEDELVKIKANKLTSAKRQLPFQYYKQPFCHPESIQDSKENFGEHLSGDQIQNTPYAISFLKSVECQKVCNVQLNKWSKGKLKRLIESEYVVNFIVDGLPAITNYKGAGPNGEDVPYVEGYLVGIFQDDKYYLHNHVNFKMLYHSDPDSFAGYRIVGFQVEPASLGVVDDSVGPQNMMPDCKKESKHFSLSDDPIQVGKNKKKTGRNRGKDKDEDDEKAQTVVYSYSVEWQFSEIRWASRWDAYLKMTGPDKIHWFAILNSLVVLVFLSGVVALIVVRTVHRDIAAYNEVPTAEEAKEETGWKLVHGDVFREPPYAWLLSVCTASGVQLLGMTVITMIAALLGMLSPAHRGSLLQAIIILFALMGILGGYVAVIYYKIFDPEGKSTYTMTVVLTATLFPGGFFGIFFLLNLFIWGEESSGAVPFPTLFALLVLWFGISLPLVFLGAVCSNKRPRMEFPTKTSKIPRAIPELPWYSNPLLACFVGGILPFGAVYTELFFIMNSLWLQKFYYIFGFLALVLVIVCFTCAEISIATTYFQLTSEDYRWWWTSYCASASSGLYVFLYAIVYAKTQLQLDHYVSVMMYFGYMFMISVVFSLVTGAVGMVSGLAFVKAIYGSIKVD